MILIFFGYALECDMIRILAMGLNMNTVNTSRYNLIAQDCCQMGTGVDCDVDGTITIDWSNMGLNGTLNSSSIPESVVELKISNNQRSFEINVEIKLK